MMLQIKVVYLPRTVIDKDAEQWINEAIQSLTQDGNKVIDVEIKRIIGFDGEFAGYHAIIKYDKVSTF